MEQLLSPQDRFEPQFRPLLDEIERRAAVAEHFLDKDLYRIYIATLWANLVMEPADAGIGEADLESLHDYLNLALVDVLGNEASITDCFRFVNSKGGEAAMDRCKLTRNHKDLLQYFSSMILDPEGHKRMASRIRDDS